MCVLAFSTVILLLCEITNFLSQHCKYVCVWEWLCMCFCCCCCCCFPNIIWNCFGWKCSGTLWLWPCLTWRDGRRGNDKHTHTPTHWHAHQTHCHTHIRTHGTVNTHSSTHSHTEHRMLIVCVGEHIRHTHVCCPCGCCPVFHKNNRRFLCVHPYVCVRQRKRERECLGVCV